MQVVTRLQGCAAIVSLVFAATVWAHTLLMVVNLNGDGTATVEGVFSTGSVAAHVDVVLEDEQGRVIWSGKTDEHGRASYPIPDVPYYVILDGGEGHRVEAEGPKLGTN